MSDNVFGNDNGVEDDAQFILVDTRTGAQKRVHRQLRVEHDAVELSVEPSVEPRIFALSRQISAHHHTNILPTRQLSGVCRRESLFEIVGVDGAVAAPLQDFRHLPRAFEIQRTAQWQRVNRNVEFAKFFAHRLGGQAEDFHLDAVGQLPSAQVENGLFAAAPFLVGDGMEYLHAAKVTKKVKSGELKARKLLSKGFFL